METPLWGWLRSSYTDKWGVPRQGGLDGSSIGILIPVDSCYTVELHNQYDGGSNRGPVPVVLTWIFNRNSTEANWNILINSRHHSDDNIVPGGRLKAMVRPPKAQCSYGCLATRSPHRPNPIGVTIATICGFIPVSRSIYDQIKSNNGVLLPHDESIIQTLFNRVDEVDPTTSEDNNNNNNSCDDDIVYLPIIKGIDLLDASPLLSIELYEPRYSLECASPAWVGNGSGTKDEELKRLKVYFSFGGYLDLLKSKNYDRLRTEIDAVISVDPRSIHSKKAHREGVFSIVLHRFIVTYKHFDDTSGSYVTVLRVRQEGNDPALVLSGLDISGIRTEKWLMTCHRLYPI